MNNISAVEMMFVDDLFGMESGYVLNFSDSSIARFFVEELNIDIYDARYSKNGTSKAKRLRCLLQTVDKPTVIRVLKALWDYRVAVNQRANRPETIPNAGGRFLDLINRLEGRAATPARGNAPRASAVDRTRSVALKSELIALASISPQARGLAFETFLKRLFDAHGLEARGAFRLVGEQIDGSFQLEGEIYLVEAKWQDAKTPAADLHTFHGKIEQKAAWTRGLFVSHSGFSEEGLHAFGRHKRLICMDGLDLWEMLEREIPINAVLQRKVRGAAETGAPFMRVRDLFNS